MRMIDADALKVCIGKETHGRQMMIGSGDVLDIIDEQPDVDAAPVRRWISVKDRLPEITEPDVHGKIAFSPKVLTYTVCDGGYTFVSIQRYINKGRWLLDMLADGRRTTHWMPLPEPPKEDDDEQAD